MNMNLFRLFSVAAAVLLLAACTQELKTARTTGHGEVPMREGSDASLSYEYDMEYVTGGVPQDVMDRINNTLIASLVTYDADESGTDVAAACKAWAKDLEDGYKADTQDAGNEFDERQDWMFNWEYGMDGAFTTACKARKLQTYTSSSNEYTGGAHGLYGETNLVFDMTTGETVTEADLFTDELQEGISDLLFDKVTEYLEEIELPDALFGTPAPNGNFSVSENGVTWYFNPYEVAPYVAGVVEAGFSWDELKPYLK